MSELLFTNNIKDEGPKNSINKEIVHETENSALMFGISDKIVPFSSTIENFNFQINRIQEKIDKKWEELDEVKLKIKQYNNNKNINLVVSKQDEKYIDDLCNNKKKLDEEYKKLVEKRVNLENQKAFLIKQN